MVCLEVKAMKTKKTIRVTRFGKPLADTVPSTLQPARSDWIGSMKDTMEIVGEIVSPANDEDDWEALRD